MPWFKVTAIEEGEEGDIIHTESGIVYFPYNDETEMGDHLDPTHAPLAEDVFLTEHGEVVGVRFMAQDMRRVCWLEHPRSDDPVRDAAYIAAHSAAQARKVTVECIKSEGVALRGAMDEAFFALSERASWDRVGPLDRIREQIGNIVTQLAPTE